MSMPRTPNSKGYPARRAKDGHMQWLVPCSDCGAPRWANAGRISRGKFLRCLKCGRVAAGLSRMGHRDYKLDRLKEPSTLEIAWAAGFYEGDGYCQLGPKTSGTQRVIIVQKNKEMLERMRFLFGGSVVKYKADVCWKWMAHGSRGRGFLMTIYSFLSERRQIQARKALGGA